MKTVFITISIVILSVIRAQGADCDIRPAVSMDGYIKSALYNSISFALKAEDDRLFSFTAEGDKLRLSNSAGTAKNYQCKVQRFGHDNRGGSEMGFECSHRGRQLYIRMLAGAKGNKISGDLLIGTNADLVQVARNWVSKDRNRFSGDVEIIRFKDVCHSGWVE